ncbi:tetratricopeptide repeat protein [Actinomyces sp. B33]|uniref:tetratricopeptide repeat protein n=1 Tax=Actinomyces sp. B33 TaxID=2942131 RepID=UPI0023411AB5|nr:tetratricopeptide repeat protein [Actinomyces sp. B33]MDC4232868.1 tetratricopeptide repeat protein [Actinomyces sp. B33]
MNDSPTIHPADSHGAIDLSAGPQAPAAASPEAPEATGLDLPLITTAGVETFESVMQTSQVVPVVVALWSSRSLESKPVVSLMEEAARAGAGAFQLVEIDVDQAPQIAQAFGLQGVPAVVALLSGRPVPLFQGPATKEQIQALIAQLLEGAAQMGVVGRIAVTEQQVAAPTPAEHEGPLALEEAGDLDAARAAWERLIDLNPRDEDAKSHLARVRIALRSAEADDSDPAARADALFAEGRQEEAFDALLGIMERTADEQERDAARIRLLDLFRVAGPSPQVARARMRLASLLMV